MKKILLPLLFAPFFLQAQTPEPNFIEVYVDTPVEICAERDPKGLYAKAAAGTLPNMTGMGQEYEPPENADLTLHGGGDLDEQVDRLVALIVGE